MKVKKVLLVALGCVGLALGAVGAVVPLLPAFPFLMLAAFCFAKSSERLHAWFTATKLYKKNLESYVVCHDAPGARWPDRAGVRVGVPHPVLLLRCEDSPRPRRGVSGGREERGLARRLP